MESLDVIMLLLLTQRLLVQSVFHQLDIRCGYEGSETTSCPHGDSCSWKVDLITCHTLDIHCIDVDEKEGVSFCGSTEECGFSTFPDLSHFIDCEIRKGGHEIKCQQNLESICDTPQTCNWRPNERFKGIENARCLPKHDVSQCIRAHPQWNLTKHLNCTVKPADNDSHPEIGETGKREGNGCTPNNVSIGILVSVLI
ncbi:hypothetical protein NFI96_024810, partial [Prochilodus magdalenae]